MGRIKILDESVSNIIAAGEVVENPASMIKELLENSLDAGSTSIKVEVRSSGRDVTILDNGSGMSHDDLFLSLERHATSKIFTKDDIFNLNTYGFRGEALASIASVSKLKLSSKRAEDEVGNTINSLGGKVTNSKEISMNRGTEIKVQDLFFNTPARLKFLRKKGTEYTKIKEIVLKEALVSPDVSFSLMLDGREVIRTSGRGIKNTILELFNRTTLKNLKEFPLGFLGNLEITRSTRDHIYTYVNGRYVKSQVLEKAILDGYYTGLTKGRYPFAIIFLDVDPREVDVNVHPSKKVIKFSDGNLIYDKVIGEVKKALDDEDIFLKTLTLKNDEVDLSDFADLLGEGKKEVVIEEEKSSKEKTTFEDLLPPVEKEKANIDYGMQEKISHSSDGKIGEVEEKFKVRENKDSFNISEERLDSKKKNFEQKDFKEEVIKTNKISLIDEAQIDKKKEKVYLEETYEEKKDIKKSTGDFRIIGQYHNSYIIVEREGVLEIYDQHIVQERTLYEKLKEKHYKKSIGKQSMLVPLKLTLDFEEKQIVINNLGLLDEFGFEIEDFGDREVLIRSVPVFDFRTSIENTFRYMLERLREETGIIDFREKILISMSCRNSIKAGEPLKYDEMEHLVEELHKIGKYTCPHGRPIILKLPLEELEKNFKRR